MHKPGQQWYGWAKVWKEETIETCVSAGWMPEFEEGWLLISDQPAGKRLVWLRVSSSLRIAWGRRGLAYPLMALGRLVIEHRNWP